MIKQIRAKLGERFLSSIILATTFITAIFISEYLFAGLMIIVAIGMLVEWYNINKKSNLYLMIGCTLIPLSIAATILLRLITLDFRPVLHYFLCIWTVDTCAMLAGQKIGGAKFAPKISPNKTWAGFFGGILASGIISFASSTIFGDDFYYRSVFGDIPIFIYGILLGALSQVSDLFVSIFKRRAGVKDSGAIIPGHGGVLDRFDSIILTAPFLLLYLHLVA